MTSKVFLVMKTHCSDEDADYPDAFVLELDKAVVDDLASKVEITSSIGTKSPDFLSANFWGDGGNWPASVEISNLLSERDFVFVNELPIEDIEDMECTRENIVTIWPDGDMIFKHWRKYYNLSVSTNVISIDQLREALNG